MNWQPLKSVTLLHMVEVEGRRLLQEDNATLDNARGKTFLIGAWRTVYDRPTNRSGPCMTYFLYQSARSCAVHFLLWI